MVSVTKLQSEQCTQSGMSLKVKILLDFEEYLELKRCEKEIEDQETNYEPQNSKLIQELSIQGSRFLLDYEVYKKLKAFEKQSSSNREK